MALLLDTEIAARVEVRYVGDGRDGSGVLDSERTSNVLTVHDDFAPPGGSVAGGSRAAGDDARESPPRG